MKKILIIGLFILLGLGSSAQSFVVDTTFSPFFDIRAGRGTIIDGLYEDSNNGRLYGVGNFSTTLGSSFFRNILTCKADGSPSLPFSFVGFNSIGGIERHSVNRLVISGSTGIGFIDTLGNTNLLSTNWGQNKIGAVKCSGNALIFPDGSSLFANGRDNSGKACKIIQGTDTFPGRHIIKLTPQGLWDSTFNHDATYGQPGGFVRYDSNRILIYGNPLRFSHYDSIPIEGMCRIYLDGTLDTTFTSPINPNISGGSFLPISADSLGRFFIVGTFYLKGDTFRTFLVRLNANGSIDTTFQYRNGAFAFNGFGGVNTITETPDKGYLIGGYFDQYQGVNKKSIVKVDSNGILEPQYFTSLGPDSADQFSFAIFQGLVSAIIPSKFGGYYVGGNFLKWDGQASQPLIKITGLNGGIPVGLEAPLGSARGASNILVFPNPTSGLVNIESELRIERMELYDLRGARLVNGFEKYPVNWSSSVFSDASIQSKQSLNHSATEKMYRDARLKSLDLTNLDNGIYFLKLIMKNGEVLTKKIIKQ
jgi:hypothetical protein